MKQKHLRSGIGISIITVVVFLLEGCALPMPDTEKLVEDVLPMKWSTETPLSDESIETFWERWNDPVLTALIDRAESANTDVLSALASVRSARASQLAATAILWPTASLSGGTDVRRQNHETTDGYNGTGRSDWTINLAGADWTRADARELRTLAKEMTLAHTRNLVAAETAQAYINYRVAQEKLRIALANVENAEKTAEVARWRAEAGVGSRSELEDSLQRLETAKARVPEIQASEAGYRNALARLTAQAVDRIDLGEAQGIPLAPEGIAVSIPAESLMRRYDVQSALKNLEASARELKAAREDYFPSLGIRGSIGTQAATLSALGASGTGLATLAGTLSLPILNWGSLEAQEESAAAELDKNKSTYIATVVKALEETDNALQGIRSAEQRRQMVLNACTHAEKAYEYASLEYKTGVGEYTMMLTAEKALLNARESVVTNAADRSNQYVVLYRALGGAWGTHTEQKN